jgi:RNA polymerase sigma-70 factor (ECF subfamily)
MIIEDSLILQKFEDEKTRNESFSMLLSKYQQKVYWHIRRMVLNHDDADDLVQDVFIKVWKNLINFRQDSQLYTWIYRIATNECITFLKKNRQKNNVPIDDLTEQLSQNLNEENYFSGDAI